MSPLLLLDSFAELDELRVSVAAAARPTAEAASKSLVIAALVANVDAARSVHPVRVNVSSDRDEGAQNGFLHRPEPIDGGAANLDAEPVSAVVVANELGVVGDIVRTDAVDDDRAVDDPPVKDSSITESSFPNELAAVLANRDRVLAETRILPVKSSELSLDSS